METMKAIRLQPITWSFTVLLALLPAALTAQSTASDPKEAEVTALKQQLADQQRQIDMLRLTLEDQKRLIERISGSATLQPGSIAAPAAPATPGNQDFTLPSKTLGQVASATPVIPAAPAAPAVVPPSILNPSQPPPAGAATNPCEANPEGQAPAFFRIGSTCVVPVGFLDATLLWRDKNAASSIGTNFGSVPYNNVANGKLSEFRFSPQNSRIGFRFDGDWKGTHFIGYNEFDFLGTSGATNLTVTNGAFVPRLRLYWVDVRRGKVEFLAGQSWSMLTPNRRGISALPGDLFYSQVMDVNYMAGLTWSRQPGFRVLYHPNEKVTFGFSAENPDQYIGGSAGGSSIVLPSAFTGLAGTQLDNSPNISVANPVLAVPTVHPDFIAKVAWDPTARFHGEIAGIERTFKIVNPNNLALGVTSTKAGGGVQLGLNGEIFKGFRLISTNYWSDGGGRYLFGQAPDVAVTAQGNLSLIHSGGTVDGFEATYGNWLIFGYYGGILIEKDVIIDTNGAKVGYGYVGSANSQNKAIQEATVGFNQTWWRSPRYGAINLIGQYEYLTRDPWSIALGAPKATHDNTIYLDIRYTLPGSMPPF